MREDKQEESKEEKREELKEKQKEEGAAPPPMNLLTTVFRLRRDLHRAEEQRARVRRTWGAGTGGEDSTCAYLFLNRCLLCRRCIQT